MDESGARELVLGVLARQYGEEKEFSLGSREFDQGWVVYVVPEPGRRGTPSYAVDREDGSVRPVGSAVSTERLIAGYEAFRASQPGLDLG